jgi:predicted deacylase
MASSSASAGYMRGGHYTLDEIYAATRGVEHTNPDLVTVSEIGKSVEGRPLLLIRIARPDGKDRPGALIYANVHADEWTGNRVALAIAERLAGDDGKDQWITSLLDQMDFYIIPLMNPDGYDRASRHLDRGFTMARDNANHVDLNRNWPQAKGSGVENISGAALGGSGFKWHPNYRGRFPLSEPENRALDELARTHGFFIIFDLHTIGGRFSYPWSFREDPPPHQDFFEAVGEELIKHQSFHPYKVHQSFSWYQIVGASKDWFYGKYGSPAITIELGDSKKFNKKKMGIRILNPFYSANPVDLQPWIDNDRDAIIHAVEKAYELTGGKPFLPQDMEWMTGE